jgi:IS5 family transposase
LSWKYTIPERAQQLRDQRVAQRPVQHNVEAAVRLRRHGPVPGSSGRRRRGGDRRHGPSTTGWLHRRRGGRRRYRTPDEAAAALRAGADAVIVGTAITDPVWITAQFAAALQRRPTG